MGVTDDKVEILEAIAWYSHAMDGMEPEAIKNAFAEDGVLIGPRVRDGKREVIEVKGHDQLVALVKGVISRFQGAGVQNRHHCNNTAFLHLDAGRATTRTYFLETRQEEGKLRLFASGCYEDELTRTPNGWRISHRLVTGDHSD